MNGSIRTLISQEQILARVTELGARIREDFPDEPITLIAVLKGSFLFVADLVRAMLGLECHVTEESVSATPMVILIGRHTNVRAEHRRRIAAERTADA